MRKKIRFEIFVVLNLFFRDKVYEIRIHGVCEFERIDHTNTAKWKLKIAIFFQISFSFLVFFSALTSVIVVDCTQILWLCCASCANLFSVRFSLCVYFFSVCISFQFTPIFPFIYFVFRCFCRLYVHTLFVSLLCIVLLKGKCQFTGIVWAMAFKSFEWK